MLTSSQRRAVRRFICRELTLVWGPPGTGKTHTVATAILILAAAHIESGQTLTVAISSLAHAGIENALLKVAQSISSFGLGEAVGLYKLDGTHLMKADSLNVVSSRNAVELEGKHPVLIIGGTAYALEKAIAVGCNRLMFWSSMRAARSSYRRLPFRLWQRKGMVDC
jgi:hypothetical protein